jgi:hypothetical protein
MFKFLFTVRNALIVFALFSLIGGIAVVVTSIILIVALRKVNNKYSTNNAVYKIFIHTIRLLNTVPNALVI